MIARAKKQNNIKIWSNPAVSPVRQLELRMEAPTLTAYPAPTFEPPGVFFYPNTTATNFP